MTPLEFVDRYFHDFGYLCDDCPYKIIDDQWPAGPKLAECLLTVSGHDPAECPAWLEAQE